MHWNRVWPPFRAWSQRTAAGVASVHVRRTGGPKKSTQLWFHRQSQPRGVAAARTLAPAAGLLAPILASSSDGARAARKASLPPGGRGAAARVLRQPPSAPPPRGARACCALRRRRRGAAGHRARLCAGKRQAGARGGAVRRRGSVRAPRKGLARPLVSETWFRNLLYILGLWRIVLMLGPRAQSMISLVRERNPGCAWLPSKNSRFSERGTYILGLSVDIVSLIGCVADDDAGALRGVPCCHEIATAQVVACFQPLAERSGHYITCGLRFVWLHHVQHTTTLLLIYFKRGSI